MTQGAQLSQDRQYRYALWRIWNEDKLLVMFIGLNPSRAGEKKDDPTIRRVTRFAYDWGYGGFYMMNLFAWVTPYPSELGLAADPVGENDRWIEEIQLKCERIVFAWGAFGDDKKRHAIQNRAAAMIQRFPGAYCLGKTSNGHPCHPLFLPGDRRPEPFS